MSNASLGYEQILEKFQQDSVEQKLKLLEIWKNGGTVLLKIEKAATDERPVADLKSEEFSNWRFQLNRRLCVKGFLHKQKVGTELELYIDGFGEDQVVYVSYIKKDHLPKQEREMVLKELRDILLEGKDVKEQIESYRKDEPFKVKINAVLKDHIIVEYKGLYGAMTSSDLFHSKSKEGMDHYRQLQQEDGTMKVYINTIDKTGNVSFSETRMPELYNNPKYKNNELGQSKWVNKDDCLKGLEIGQTVECVLWHYSKSGLFVLFKNRGDYVQSLIPYTALTELDILLWAEQHPLNSTTAFRIQNIDLDQKRVTLFPTEIKTPKYPQQVVLESRTTAQVNEEEIKEGQLVDIEIICESKVDQDILHVRCGNYRGLTYVNEDLPDCLKHESGRNDNGKIKRGLINKMIDYNNSKDSTIKLPAIARIKNDGDTLYYNFSVLEASGKCIEQLDDQELAPNYREVEIVLSWTNPITNERYAILRWHNLLSFFYFEPEEIHKLNYEGDWEPGSKLTLWINGIEQDLSFDAEFSDPRPYWESLKINVGDYVFVNQVWQSKTGIYRIKYKGCTGFVLPGFKPDEEQVEYQLKVVLFDKEKRILVLSDGTRQLVTKSDVPNLSTTETNADRSLHPYLPLNNSLFLAEDSDTKKWAIIQMTPSAYAFACVIYRNLNIGTFVRLDEAEEAHFKYREYILSCNYTKDNNNVKFLWHGKIAKTTYPKFNENFGDILEKNGIEKVGWFYNMPYDLTCKDLMIKCKIIEGERDKIKNWTLLKQRKPKVYFTGKLLYSNHEIYPLFSFNDPQIAKNTIINHQSNNITVDCRVIIYDERTKRYLVDCGGQRGLLDCRQNKKELRYLPNEIVKGTYKNSIEPISKLPYLSEFEDGIKIKPVIDHIYKAELIGRRMEGALLRINSQYKNRNAQLRIFIPNSKLFTTKQEYDKELPDTIEVIYKGRDRGTSNDIFELAHPHIIDNRPEKGTKCSITILSKNEKGYDAYINEGHYKDLIGLLPSESVYLISKNNITYQFLLPGDTINAIVDEKSDTGIIYFQYPYNEQFKKGLVLTGKVVSEREDFYVISFGNIYGITDKDKTLSVERSYRFSYLKYTLKSDGPYIGAEYKVILNVTPTINISKNGRLLGRITGYDKELIYIESGNYNFYTRIASDNVSRLFMNRFGKIEIYPSTEVYVNPIDDNGAAIHNGIEVSIIKIKS